MRIRKLTSFFQLSKRVQFMVLFVTQDVRVSIPLHIVAREHEDGTYKIDGYMFWEALAPEFRKLRISVGNAIVIHGSDALLATQTDQGWECSLPGPGTELIFDLEPTLKIFRPRLSEWDCSSVESLAA
ncbi:hypothetical protein FRC12_003156 [Ceratobasidium sp. 428]|nr:hypothetical protein FRC12_003156 [Ceratobasidium sp. 428]